MSQSAPAPVPAAELPPVQAPSIRCSSARVRVDGAELDLHYRVTGSGPPLFALHPSPLDSAFMAPLMGRLASRATVIAPDTPGFGDSDPLPGPIDDLSPCVRAMAALRQALGLERVGVYGSATGAQIAVEWAKAEPQALSGIMLDNAAAFDDAERSRIIKGYLPDVTPSPDGSHLARAWLAAHDATLFFPWQAPSAENRIAQQLAPAAAMQATARGYLRAGPGYAACLSRRLPQRAGGALGAGCHTLGDTALAGQHPGPLDGTPRHPILGRPCDHGSLRALAG